MATRTKLEAVPEAKEPIPTFKQGTALDIPDRERMTQALDRAMEAVMFKVEHFIAEDATNLTAYQGGMKRWAGEVACLFEDAMVLATMRESLSGQG